MKENRWSTTQFDRPPMTKPRTPEEIAEEWLRIGPLADADYTGLIARKALRPVAPEPKETWDTRSGGDPEPKPGKEQPDLPLGHPFKSCTATHEHMTEVSVEIDGCHHWNGWSFCGQPEPAHRRKP